MILEDVKRLLGLKDENTDRDDLLEWIIESAQERLKNLLGGVDDIPAGMEHIVVEASVIRFNRIGSEGIGSHTVEGESLTFNENDFSGFMDEINAYLDKINQNSNRGGFKFL